MRNYKIPIVTMFQKIKVNKINMSYTVNSGIDHTYAVDKTGKALLMKICDI